MSIFQASHASTSAQQHSLPPLFGLYSLFSKCWLTLRLLRRGLCKIAPGSLLFLAAPTRFPLLRKHYSKPLALHHQNFFFLLHFYKPLLVRRFCALHFYTLLSQCKDSLGVCSSLQARTATPIPQKKENLLEWSIRLKRARHRTIFHRLLIILIILHYTFIINHSALFVLCAITSR